MTPLARSIHLATAAALLAAAPFALGQKMYKCKDDSGATVFQQAPCPETAKDAEARLKEKARLEAEAAQKKQEEERKKAEAIAKARERDKAYERELVERAEERRKADEAAKKLMQGTSLEGKAPAAAVAVPAPAGAGPAAPADDGGLPPNIAPIYPGPWKDGPLTLIATAFAKKSIQGCEPYRYRQRGGGGTGEFLVQCKPGDYKVSYFVWPQTLAVKGPVRF